MPGIISRRSVVSSAHAVSSSALRITEISKRFVARRRWSEVVRAPFARHHASALRDVSFDVGAGEVVGLLGANGAGKTTLLKILSTLILPDSGRAEICGVDVVRSPEQVRVLVAPVTADERSLEWRLSARENLLFYAALCGIRPADARARVSELLERVELRASGEKLVGQFSTGMRQRLLVARALLRQPRVLLLDEPTRSMDPIAARSFREMVRNELVANQRCTVVLATHDPDEALEMCDRVAILDRGRLLAIDTPRALAREYSDDMYRIFTSTPDHEAFRPWRAADGSGIETVGGLEGVDIRIDRGTDASDVLNELVFAGARVHGFEKLRPSLADIIERVTTKDSRPARV